MMTFNMNSFTTFFFIYVSFFFAFFSSSSSSVSALPLQKRDVIDPPIISPDASTVWAVGSTQTVTWDVSQFTPDQLNGKVGMLVLGFDTFTSENLMLENPLAQNFSLTDEKVQITVPDVPTRANYIVVLFGDSGNSSPNFTITGSPSASSSTPLSSSSAVSSSVSLTSSPVSTIETSASSPVVLPTSVASTAVITSPSESTSSPASSSPSAVADTNSSSSVSSPSSSASVTPSPTPSPSSTTSAAFAMQIPHVWSVLLGSVLAGAVALL